MGRSVGTATQVGGTVKAKALRRMLANVVEGNQQGQMRLQEREEERRIQEPDYIRPHRAP